jgi:hypothetical protein
VIERFFRGQKEQMVHGCINEAIAEVLDAVRPFIARCKAE